MVRCKSTKDSIVPVGKWERSVWRTLDTVLTREGEHCPLVTRICERWFTSSHVAKKKKKKSVFEIKRLLCWAWLGVAAGARVLCKDGMSGSQRSFRLGESLGNTSSFQHSGALLSVKIDGKPTSKRRAQKWEWGRGEPPARSQDLKHRADVRGLREALFHNCSVLFSLLTGEETEPHELKWLIQCHHLDRDNWGLTYPEIMGMWPSTLTRSCSYAYLHSAGWGSFFVEGSLNGLGKILK